MVFVVSRHREGLRLERAPGGLVVRVVIRQGAAFVLEVTHRADVVGIEPRDEARGSGGAGAVPTGRAGRPRARMARDVACEDDRGVGRVARREAKPRQGQGDEQHEPARGPMETR